MIALKFMCRDDEMMHKEFYSLMCSDDEEVKKWEFFEKVKWKGV